MILSDVARDPTDVCVLAGYGWILLENMLGAHTDEYVVENARRWDKRLDGKTPWCSE